MVYSLWTTYMKPLATCSGEIQYGSCSRSAVEIRKKSVPDIQESRQVLTLAMAKLQSREYCPEEVSLTVGG